MGLKFDTPNAGNGAASQQQQQTGNTLPKVASIGFDTKDIFVMKSELGSEYVNKLAEEIRTVYTRVPEAKGLKVTILDKEVFTNLAYSAIVVSNIIKTKVYYHILLLSGTGRKALDASDIANTIQQLLMQQGGNTQNIAQEIFTLDDAIDRVLHEEVLNAIAPLYKETSFISADGTVVPREHSEMIAVKIASIAYNAVTIDGVIDGETLADLNIRHAVQGSKTSELRLETNLLHQTVLDEVEKPVRHDFSVDLNSSEYNNRLVSLNLQNSKITLAKVTGFIDSIPEIVPTANIPMVPGAIVPTAPRLHPHIILNYDDVRKPTTGFMLLGILAGTVMSNENTWLQALMPKDKKDPHNVGALNILTNLGNNQNKIGEKLDLTNKSLNDNEKYGLLKQMFSLDPIISYDVESFGPQAYFTSVLAIAAEPGNSNGKLAACSEIIDTANWLTDGEFGTDFNHNDIFINSGVVVPMGTWADKTGVRDIRDIDLAFIANMTEDVELLNKWTRSNMPKDISGIDPFITKCEIIAKLIPDAEISGKAIRVTFTSMFINRLVNAAMAAGLNARIDTPIIFAENNNLGVVSNFLQGAGVNNAAGFARQSMQNGYAFNMGYTNMGQNRY